MTIASAALLLFLILDPLGNIPVFLSLLRGLPARRQRIVLARELVIALGVLMAFGLVLVFAFTQILAGSLTFLPERQSVGDLVWPLFDQTLSPN